MRLPKSVAENIEKPSKDGSKGGKAMQRVLQRKRATRSHNATDQSSTEGNSKTKQSNTKKNVTKPRNAKKTEPKKRTAKQEKSGAKSDGGSAKK